MKNSKISKILKSRQFKYGAIAIIAMVLTVIIFVVLNLGAGLIYAQLDLTPERLFSLGDQTRDVLEGLDQEVVIYGLFDETKITSADNYVKVMELLRKYDNFENITVRYVNPAVDLHIVNELDPDRVLNITARNFVVESQGRKRVIRYFDLFELIGSEYTPMIPITTGTKMEMAFTSAIYYVSRKAYTTVYFVTGHNEFHDQNGHETIANAIRLNGFGVNQVNIRTYGGIPADADILVISNPQSDFHPIEITALRQFMAQGKSLYVLLDSAETLERFTNLQEFLADYHVQFGYTRIKENDPAFYLAGNPHIILPELANNLINRPVRDSIADILARNVRSIEILRRTGDNLKVEGLLLTSSRAIQEGMYADINTRRGATYVAAAVEDQNSGARLIISGTAEYVHDVFLHHYRPYAEDAIRFFLNSINWLEGDIGTVFIAPKDIFQNIVSMTARQRQGINIFVIYIIPGIILLTGLVVYLRRRNL